MNNTTGLIISAGFSKRMVKFKPLIIYNKKSFLENIAYKLSLVCNKIIIVTGYNSDLIVQHIQTWENELKNKIDLVFNPNYEAGMFTSLQEGVKQCKTEWLLYHFVDQPDLPQEFYEEFTLQNREEFDWLQPVYKGRKGHPVLFNSKVMRMILKSSYNLSLKQISVVNQIRKKYWQCKYSKILNDYNFPGDLKE